MTIETDATWWWSARQEGQGVVEYALVMLLVAIVVVGVLTVTGDRVVNAVQDIAAKLGG